MSFDPRDDPGVAAARDLRREVGWDQRIARARQLAERYPAVSHLLTFYASLAAHQQSLPELWSPAAGASFRDALDVDRILSTVPRLLSWLQREESAPRPLVAEARTMADLGAATWRAHLESFLTSPESVPAPCSFVLDAIVQPFAERVALAHEPSRLADSPLGSRCPVCDGLPVAAALREEAHGAKRTLVCGLCFTEWSYPRLLCPACPEQRFDALPVFTAEQFPHVRLDACDTCRVYLKTIDFTKDGLAVAVVDDIATVTTDLWAREQGYMRLRANMLRIQEQAAPIRTGS